MIYKSFYIMAFLMVLSLASSRSFCQSKRSDRLFAEGVELFEAGDFYKAIECFSKADALDQKELPLESSRGSYSKSWIAHCYYKLDNYAKAKEYDKYHYFVKPVDRRLTVISDKYADQSYQAFSNGNLEVALEHALKCIDAEEKILGKYSISYAGSCSFISLLYMQLKDYDKCLEYCNDGLNVLDSLSIKNDALSFQLLQGRVDGNLSKGLTALTLLDINSLKAIAAIEESEYGDRYPDALVKILETRIELVRRDFPKAADIATKAFWTIIDIYNPDNEDIFMSLSDCLTQLDMVESTSLVPGLLNEALPILKKKNLSAVHEGRIISWLGDYAKDLDTSLAYHLKASELLHGADNKDSFFSNQCMLARNYADKYEFRKAVGLFEEVCQYYEKKDSLNASYRNALMNLGDIYLSLGDAVQAGIKYKTLVSVLQDYKNTPEYILSMLKWIPVYVADSKGAKNNLSWESGYNFGTELKGLFESLKLIDFIDSGIGIHQVASVLLPVYRLMVSDGTIVPTLSWQKIEQEVKSLVYDWLIPVCSLNNPLTCEGLSILAQTKYLLGFNNEAISLTQQIIDIAKAEGWTYNNYLHDLAYYQYDSGDCENAYPNFRIGYDFLKDAMLQHYRWMTLEERANYTNSHRGNLDNMAHYAAITPQDSRYAELGYDALLFTKGLLLNSSIELTKLLHEEGDKDAMKLLDEWRKINLQLETAKNTGSLNLEALKSKSSSLEKHLLEKSKSFGDYTDGLNVSWRDVQSALGADDVAVEFCSYQKSARARQYGAIILTKNSSPLYVDLGKDSDWLPSSNAPDAIMDSGLYEKIFSNLIPFLPSKNRGVVYFAPDGIFHMIPIENLLGAESYNLRRLSSTRELALNKTIDSKASSMVLFGGVDYGLGELASFYDDAKKGKRTASEFLEYLPGTLEEVDLINKSVGGRFLVDVMKGRNATKTNFMKYSGKRPDVIHVATHGFFSTPGEQPSQSMDPMDCSGLYFAGAQNTLWNMDIKKLKDNGILTAQEISSLDLRGVKLAVLSACETGLGSITPDGVFGLQRGFKQAGVQSLMISLWKVDDEVTKLLMTEFYEGLIDGLHPYDSLKKAQSKVQVSFPNSKDWAAFVLVDANNVIKL